MSGRQFDDDLNTYLLHSYFKLDSYISHDFGPRVEIFSSAENLFDRNIEVGRTPTLTLGMGRTVRAEHETCLIATRGRPSVRSRSVRSTFTAPVGAHSAKPDSFYSLVEQLCHGPFAELFARRRRPGWTQHGNQLPEIQEP